MTEQNASPQQRPLFQPPDHHHLIPSSSRDHERDRDYHAPGSPETGGSSRSDTLMNSSSTANPTLAHRPHEVDPSALADSTGLFHNHAVRETKRSSHHHKSNKHKSTGAFLLSDPFEEPAADELRGRKQRSRRNIDKGKGKGKGSSTQQSDEAAQNTRLSGTGLGLPPDLKKGNGSLEPGTPPRASGAGLARRHEDLLQVSPGVPSPGSSNASADMDSTQIVSMALNLSESRRLAQRRIGSQTLPPRLASLPSDNMTGGTLRQQLQQQRRASRTMSPRPDRDAAPRISSSGKLNGNGTLQPAFEPIGNEGSYRYNFSNSTLARAQKAKDYMELLAQYRRVIELLPPLKPNSLSKVSTSELFPSMPMSLDTVNLTGQIGRPYDPLQYIRNRKVRARERKTIDGESQGFGDVSRVTDWIDDVAKWVATRQIRTPGSPALPPFSGADVFSMEHSPPAQISRVANATVKTKRPRNDWVIEPADLLADIYWLEQDDHKKLVENRHWQRVFPQDSGLYRPLSRATDEPSPSNNPLSAAQPSANGAKGLNGKSTIDHATSSTRGKAREKLREIRGFHRHSGLSHGDKQNHSRLRVRRDSSSSSSSSDSDVRSWRGTLGDNDKDILEKQMMEMMERDAREAKEQEAQHSQETEVKPLKPLPSDIAAARPPMSISDSTTPSRQPSHSEFRIDARVVEDKATAGRSRTSSPQRPSRESLDVPSLRGRRMSIGSESSVPNSPDYRGSLRDNYFIPGIGADLSPTSSRAGSPSRNPLSRVKQIFRDRSRDRVVERHYETISVEKEGYADFAAKAASRLPSTPGLGSDKAPLQSRTSSVGPDSKLVSRPTGDSQKSHRKSNSLRLVDPGAGLRSLFKGPRIDSVLKSGVSKVSDLFWKKESEEDGSDSAASLFDDSDDESRGRRKQTDSVSPTPSLRDISIQPKQEGHYLEVMPAFLPASEYKGRHSRNGSENMPVSRTTSRRSTRFELLKPPRIDISAATDPPSEPNKDQVPDATDVEARPVRIREEFGQGDRQQSLVRGSEARNGVSAESIRNSRHFSIAGRDLSPQRGAISKHEIARLRTMVLSSGVMAMEMSRRANEVTTLTTDTTCDTNSVLCALGNKVAWPEIVQLVSEDQRQELLAKAVSQAGLFPITAHVLGTAIHSSRQRWKSEAESFKHRIRAELINGRIEQLRQRVGLDLTALTRTAAEEADEVGGDLVDGQRRKVKAVMDVIDKLLRRRRRRFRWVRRAGWLALEWLLVGFMWYVWFVVMIARIFLGVGKGMVRSFRWLLWL
ncbi:hypothetical protein N0V93_001869 [Gnomoniopsis smithogilvyi]|uniref:Uncharacterized protein n=1 Tax=Gnomoniopsis smithogilvyi TaxID=1191159 RepID=A0A9W8Z4D1_9PEZI|nr:hypothetical protein N0V93_001869 [Gnomoniopsis smithogilvyi]